MADLISEIVSQEAFEQVRKLTADLNILTDTMDKAIATGAGNNKMIDANSVKAASEAVTNLTNTTNKLVETESERLNIERQIKAEGEKMAANVKVTSNAIEQAAAKYKLFSNSQKELAQYIMETDRRLAEIKDTLKSADRNASNYAQATANLKVEQAQLKAELSEATKELKRTITEQKYADDSMKGMSVRLEQLRDLYAMFTAEERSSDFGMTISEGINELDEKIKGLDKSIGNNQRTVGNYEIAGKSLRSQIMDIVNDLGKQKIIYRETEQQLIKQRLLVDQLTKSKGSEASETKEAVIELARMESAYKKAGIAINQLEQQGGKLQDVYADTRRSIKGVADDAGNTKAMAEGIGVLGNSFQMFQAGMVALGFEGEEMNKIFMKMMIVQQGFNSLTQITNALQSESVLRLKMKAIWDKVVLVFTQKKTAATIAETAAETTNTTATTGAAAATVGLATAEGVATTTSWTLVGSLKAVGVAIKSIPVIGWILAAVAALGTLTVLLYKHLSAEKELTAEQIQRKKLTEGLNTINQKVNESTLENVTRVKFLQKELGKVKQGSKEYQSIVEEINTLTGLQFNTIKATPAEIAKGTDAWIKQYKIRAKAEAIIQQIVENELEFQKLKNDVQFASADDRVSTIDKLLLTPKQKEYLLSQLNFLKSNASAVDKSYASKNVQDYLRIAETNMNNINAGLEKQITLEGLITDEKENQGKTTTKDKKDNTIKNLRDAAKASAAIEEKRIETIIKNNEILVNTLNELEEIRLNNSTISENELTDRLITLEKSRSNEIIKQNNRAKDKEIEGLEIGSEQYLSVVNKYEVLNQLALEKSILRQAQIRKDGYTKTVAEIKRQIELSKAGLIIQQGGALSPEQEAQFAISGIKSQISALDSEASTMDPLTQEYRDYVDQRKLLEAELTLETEKQSQLRIETLQREKQQQLELTAAIGGAVFAIGDALTQNIKDEKKRVQVEQGLAVAKVLLNQAIAISEAVALAATTSGTVYTIPIAIASAVGSIVAAMFQAQQAISQAKANIVSTYAEGTDYHKGGAAIVGEGGQPEMVKVGSRTTWITEPTYIPNLPVGASVTPLSDMQQDKNMNDYWLEQIATGSRASVNIDVSGRLLPALHKDMRTIRFANKLIQARG